MRIRMYGVSKSGGLGARERGGRAGVAGNLAGFEGTEISMLPRTKHPRVMKPTIRTLHAKPK